MCERESICLSCLRRYSKKLTCVSDLDIDGVSILEKLKDCVSPDLVKDDKNLKICQSCILALNSSYEFKKSVLKSLKTLNCLEKSILFKEEPDIAQDAKPMSSSKESIMSNCLKESIIFKEEPGIAPNDKQISSSKESNMFSMNRDKFMNNANKEEIHEIIEQMRNESLLQKNNKSEIINNDLNCNRCCSTSETECELQQNVKIHKANFSCMFCGNVYKTSFHLKEHITSHTGEKNYNCGHCDKAFPRLSSLKRHMKSHYAPLGQKTKKTPFLCTICGKSFPFSNGASRHMRIHFGVKTHECQVCNKKFNQSTHLHVHMRTHSGEKPYICENCGECFTLKAGLHKHLKTRHKNDNLDNHRIAKNEFSLENEVGAYFNQFSF